MIDHAEPLRQGIPEPIPGDGARRVGRVGIRARRLPEAGAEREEVELPVLLDEVQALGEPLALARGLEFRCGIPDTLHPQCRRHRARPRRRPPPRGDRSVESEPGEGRPFLVRLPVEAPEGAHPPE